MKIEVLSNQTLSDIALQVYGDIEGVFSLAVDNGLSVTDELHPGQVIEYYPEKVINKAIVQYYSAREIYPATLSKEEITGIFDNTFDSTFN
mgnify:CR=1 FL=1|jgi:hypothetical protein